MSKVSRELVLLQVLLRERLINDPAPSSGGGQVSIGVGPLKLVEFTQADGDRLAVNPDHVASVEERGLTKTRIKMQDGSDHTVEAAFADVAADLQE